jgi:hypothetical protein
MRSVHCLQGIFELGAGFGFSMGPSIGGALYQVQETVMCLLLSGFYFPGEGLAWQLSIVAA